MTRESFFMSWFCQKQSLQFKDYEKN